MEFDTIFLSLSDMAVKYGKAYHVKHKIIIIEYNCNISNQNEENAP